MKCRLGPVRHAGGRQVCRQLWRTCSVVAWLLLAGCEGAPSTGRPQTTGAVLERVAFADLPNWPRDRLSDALPALRSSCKALTGKPPDSPVGPAGEAGTVRQWQPACTALMHAERSDDTVQRHLEAWFVPFAVAGADGTDGLFTGYYEPEVRGSQQPSAAYGVPLYRRPPDLVTDLSDETLVGRVLDGRLRPYETRAEIEAGALAGLGLELLWLADPIEAFFLQVQGSGRVRLPDGRVIRVGYAASNGHPFTAIGRLLVERGELTREAATMQTVRQWLRDHPAEAPGVMEANARYIFFRELPGDGPFGSLGVVLTPGRSLAVDASLIPLGAPLWLDTTYSEGTPEAGQPLRRLMVAQDTGGAIKGAVRGDVYWGSGEAALQYAGPMKQRGRYYLLLPKAVAEAKQAMP